VAYIELRGTKQNIWLLNRVGLEINNTQSSDFTNCGHRKLKSADQFQVGLKVRLQEQKELDRGNTVLEGNGILNN